MITSHQDVEEVFTGSRINRRGLHLSKTTRPGDKSVKNGNDKILVFSWLFWLYVVHTVTLKNSFVRVCVKSICFLEIQSKLFGSSQVKNIFEKHITNSSNSV